MTAASEGARCNAAQRVHLLTMSNDSPWLMPIANDYLMMLPVVVITCAADACVQGQVCHHCGGRRPRLECL